MNPSTLAYCAPFSGSFMKAPKDVGTRAVLAAVLCAPFAALGQTDSQLRYACKQFVERSLHDPGGADLSEWSQGQVYQGRKSNEFVVRFRGRAKNAYGALRLATFECTIVYKHPDHFTPAKVRAVE